MHVRGNDDELEGFFLEGLSPKAMGEKWMGQLLEAYWESESVIISAETNEKRRVANASNRFGQRD